MLQSDLTSCLLAVCFSGWPGFQSRLIFKFLFFFFFSHNLIAQSRNSQACFSRLFPQTYGNRKNGYSVTFLIQLPSRQEGIFFLTGSRFRHWCSHCTGDKLTCRVTRHGPSLSTFTRPEQETPANTDTLTETRETESAPKNIWRLGRWLSGKVLATQARGPALRSSVRL